MLKPARHEAIIEMLNQHGSILVSDVCDKLHCSDQTIRRDLQQLESEGKLKRIHGGAYLPAEDDKGVPVQLKAKLLPNEKVKMSLTAHSFIKNDDTIMLDSSTTCYTMAKYIVDSNVNVTIITNSLSIIGLFEDASKKTRLIGIGGRYNKRSGSFVGNSAIKNLSNYVADKSFISCSALSIEYGMLDNYERQCAIRQTMLNNSKERYLLVDHTKFDDNGNFIINHLDILNSIITDQKPSEKWLNHFNKNNIKIIW